MIRIQTLTEALAALKTAQDAKAAFVESKFDEEKDSDVAATEVRIESAVAELDDENEPTSLASEAGYIAADKENVKQAKIDAAVAAAKSEITVAQAELTAAQAAVNAKAGLSAAAANLANRDAAAETSAQALLDAEATEAAAFAALETQANATYADRDALIPADTTPAAIAAAPLRENATTGALELNPDWKLAGEAPTAAQKAAAQQVLNAIVSADAAKKSDLAVNKALLEATVNVGLTEKAETTAYGNVVTAYKTAIDKAADATITTVTLTQIKAAQAELLGKVIAALKDSKTEITYSDTDFTITNPATDFSGDTAPDEFDDYNTLQDVVSTYGGLVAGDMPAFAPLTNAVKTANTNLETDQKALDDLNELIEARKAAIADQEELERLEGEITAAQEVFETLGFSEPVVLAGTPEVATTESDLYVVAELSTQIVNFGLEGEDKLFIGNNFTLNAGALKDGDDAVLEVFFIQDGNNAKVVLETKAYGSSEAGVAEVEITLTGVKAADLTLTEDGFVTLA